MGLKKLGVVDDLDLRGETMRRIADLWVETVQQVIGGAVPPDLGERFMAGVRAKMAEWSTAGAQVS